MGAARAIRQSDPTAVAEAVIMSSRQERAHDLHLAGASWRTIAQELGFASAKVAQMTVRAYLEKSAVQQGAERRREALDLELDRLDRLQTGFWDDALNGDLRAAMIVIKIIAQRSALWGFGGRDNTIDDRPRTVVIVDGDSEQYVGTLKMLIAQSEEPAAG